MPYYTKGDKQMTATGDTSALVAEFEAERAALETAFAAVEADTGAASTHATGDGSDHANVATNDAHVAGDGSDHANVATNDAHVAGDGSDHANVAANTAHAALVAGNPHQVTGLEVPYVPANPANWAVSPPPDLMTAIQRLEQQVQILTGGPIP